MTLEILKRDIFGEVEKRSALEGLQLPERFEGIWASEDDRRFLDSYWTEGCSAVAELLKRYLKGVAIAHSLDEGVQDEVLRVNAVMPSRYNFAFDEVIATELKMMMACSILYRWLNVVLPEKAVKYDEESKGYMESVRDKLLYRDEPRWQKPVEKGVCDNVFMPRRG